MADGPRVGLVQGEHGVAQAGFELRDAGGVGQQHGALAAAHRERLGRAAAGSEDVLPLGVLGANGEF